MENWIVLSSDIWKINNSELDSVALMEVLLYRCTSQVLKSWKNAEDEVGILIYKWLIS